MPPIFPITRSGASRARRLAGVTLIELVVVITITGIIAVVLGTFIVRPIEGFRDTVRRAELVDAAEMALRRTARDIRRALPNSVRIRDSLGNVDNVTCTVPGVTCAIEMLNTVDGGRYREGPGMKPGGHNHANMQFRLKIDSNDSDGFNIIGLFQHLNEFETSPGAFNSTGTPFRLAIYNQGESVPTANAYIDGDESLPPPVAYVITRPGTTTFQITGDCETVPLPGCGDEHWIRPLAGGFFRFSNVSPNQRVFIVDTPVTYLCTAGPGGTIRRYENYPIQAAPQPTNPAALPLSAGTEALLTTPVTSCTFTYTAGTNQRAGLITLAITVSDAASGEQVRLLHQVHVDNSP